jgi:hypothetical protein
MTKPSKTVSEKPIRIVINEPIEAAFASAAALVRDGYVFCRYNRPQTFDFIGQATITLVLGDPDADAVASAVASQTLALKLQQVQTEREAREAEMRERDEQERLTKRAELAQEVADAKVRLKQLEQAQRFA